MNFSASPLVLLVPLLVGGVILVAVVAYRLNEKKIRIMQATAASHGWTWVGDADQWVDAWDVEPFGRGMGRRVENCVEGTYRGVPFLAFEYEFYTESTTTDSEGRRHTSRQTHHFDVAVLRLGANLPDLHLSPEGGFARLVDAMTGHDIDLEYDAFNRAFRLHCADRKFAFDVFHARTMEYVLGHRDVTVDLVGGDVVLSRDGGGFDPEIYGPGDENLPLTQGQAPFDVPLAILAGIPDFVWQDRGGRPVALAGLSSSAA